MPNKETDQKKDRSKNAKFTKSLASGALPEWLEQEWETSKKLKTGKNERQRMVHIHSWPTGACFFYLCSTFLVAAVMHSFEVFMMHFLKHFSCIFVFSQNC